MEATTPHNMQNSRRPSARFRLTAPLPKEDSLHESVAGALLILLHPDVPWTTFPAGHIKLSGQQAAKLSRLGLRRNWPDLQVLWDGTLYGIELKRPGETLSRTRFVRTRRGALRLVEGQAEAFPRLERQGMKIAVCDNLDDVLAQISAWGIPMRKVAL